MFRFTTNDRTRVSIYHNNLAGVGEGYIEDEESGNKSLTGNRYTLNHSRTDAVTHHDVGSTFTQTLQFRVIGHGEAPDFRLRLLVHTTINNNGEVTSEVVSVDEEECSE